MLFFLKSVDLSANKISNQNQDTVAKQWLVIKVKPRFIEVDSSKSLVRINSNSLNGIFNNYGLKEKVKMMYQFQNSSRSIRTMVGQQLIQPNYNNVFKILLPENVDIDALVNILKANQDILSVQKATTPKLD
jgi:hypothetical protein